MKSTTEKRVLVVDGHNSHFSMEFLQFCSHNQIELFYLPLYRTHILQPLDIALFGPLQKCYGCQVEDDLCIFGEAISKRNFLT